MSPRPWQVSAIVFLVLTLLYWSNFKVDLTVRGFPLQAYFPQTHVTASAGSAATAVAQPTTVNGPFPQVNTKKSPKTNLTTVLLSSDAKKMQSSLIPKEGTRSSYGLTFNLATFNQMKNWDSSISVDPSLQSRFDTITNSAYHPCCGSAINTKKCGCGHAVGMEGLVKKMLQDGKSDQEINTELLQWGKYFFPRHYVIVALALTKMNQSTNQINLTESYSSQSVEQAAGNFLIYD